MILVTGATGHLGTAVIQTLLEKTSTNQIAALVRDESKASALKEIGVDIRVGSYDDTASLNKAMQGIEKVLLIAGTDEDNRLQQHQNVVDAARKAGVQCIAYTSRSLKDRTTLANQLMEGHFQTEAMLNITRALNNDRLIRALTGLNRKAFDELCVLFAPVYEASLQAELKPQTRQRWGQKGPFRKHSMSYFKCYPTFDYIKKCGLSYVLFRNVLYMDAIPQFVGESVFETGINLPTGQGRVPFALRSEMGEAIAHVLLESGCSNRIYKLTGSETYSFDDIAATLSDLSGKEVDYTPAEKSAFEAQMKGRGVPEMMIERVVGFLTDIKNGQEDEVSPDLENLLGRKPASLREGLKALFKL